MMTSNVTMTPRMNFFMRPPDGILWQMGGVGR
jgi:hypothetical protein